MSSHETSKSLDEWFWRISECQDATKREALLAEMRRENESMADALQGLLAASKELGSFMQIPDEPQPSPSLPNSTLRLDASRPSVPAQQRAASAVMDHPEKIGPYRLLEPIGEGGMGVVYLAQQEHPVRRKVAIKVIKPGMDSRQVIARFEAERQALAMMEHPNIAQVLDAGTTDNGLPYFVMELVRGIPITEYCDRARMSVQRRLELLQSACGALQHAHNKGIIHRDIKPSNVLVTEHDGTPVVKVIELGSPRR